MDKVDSGRYILDKVIHDLSQDSEYTMKILF